jgi:hypothetical protein
MSKVALVKTSLNGVCWPIQLKQNKTYLDPTAPAYRGMPTVTACFDNSNVQMAMYQRDHSLHTEGVRVE